MKKTLLSLLFMFSTILVYSWGNDVLVGFQATGKATIVATAGGKLYSSIPAGTTGVGGLRIFSSTDLGQTWTPAGTVPGLNVVKSKLVVTSTDSVYCVYQADSAVFVYSITANVSTQFTQMNVEDFDVASSANGNCLYLFTDDAGNNSIRRVTRILRRTHTGR